MQKGNFIRQLFSLNTYFNIVGQRLAAAAGGRRMRVCEGHNITKSPVILNKITCSESAGRKAPPYCVRHAKCIK